MRTRHVKSGTRHCYRGNINAYKPWILCYVRVEGGTKLCQKQKGFILRKQNKTKLLSLSVVELQIVRQFKVRPVERAAGPKPYS